MSTRVRLALLAGPVAFLGLLFVWPVLGIVGTGLRDGGQWRIDDGVATVGDHLDTLAFTAWQALLSTAATFAVALPLTWGLSRFRFAGGAALRALVALPFVLPTVVVATAIRSVVGPSGALAGWVRSTLAPDKGVQLRTDLDRLVTQALIPERVKRASDDSDSGATARLTSEWEEAKGKWIR